MKYHFCWPAGALVGALLSQLPQTVPAAAQSSAMDSAPMPWISTVPARATDIRPLLVGSLTPNVQLADINGTPFKLADAVAKKPTVLIFYRGGWCPFCNAQMGQLQNIVPELSKLGYQVLAISADRPEELKKSIAKHSLTYTLLSDSAAMEASRAFGVAFHVDDPTIGKYKGYGVDLEGASGAKHHVLPVPSVFVLSTDGVIQFSYSNPDYRIRLAPEVLMAAAKAALVSPRK